jgi:hypothetical protein
MLTQLEMIRVQLVFEKVVSVADAAISPQIQGIHIFVLFQRALSSWMICVPTLHFYPYIAFINPRRLMTVKARKTGLGEGDFKTPPQLYSRSNRVITAMQIQVAA